MPSVSSTVTFKFTFNLRPLLKPGSATTKRQVREFANRFSMISTGRFPPDVADRRGAVAEELRCNRSAINHSQPWPTLAFLSWIDRGHESSPELCDSADRTYDATDWPP